MNSSRPPLARKFIVAVLSFSLSLGPSADLLFAGGSGDVSPTGGEGSRIETIGITGTVVRAAAALFVTSALKGALGMAPGYVSALVPSLGPGWSVPLLIGAGLVEGAITLGVFSAIMGKRERRWMVRSFLLASVVSVSMSYFLAGAMAPWLLTVLSNAVQIALFSLLTRPPDKSITEHIVDEVAEAVGAEEPGKDVPTMADTADGLEVSAATLGELRHKAYVDYLSAEDAVSRTEAYRRFKSATERLGQLRSSAVSGR